MPLYSQAEVLSLSELCVRRILQQRGQNICYTIFKAVVSMMLNNCSYALLMMVSKLRTADQSSPNITRTDLFMQHIVKSCTL